MRVTRASVSSIVTSSKTGAVQGWVSDFVSFLASLVTASLAFLMGLPIPAQADEGALRASARTSADRGATRAWRDMRFLRSGVQSGRAGPTADLPGRERAKSGRFGSVHVVRVHLARGDGHREVVLLGRDGAVVMLRVGAGRVVTHVEIEGVEAIGALDRLQIAADPVALL